MSNLAENLPIYIHINQGIKEAILSGAVKEGEQITSTTVILKQYKLNIATVNKAINTLVDEGIVFKKRALECLSPKERSKN